VRLVRSEAPRCHPKDPLRPSKHEHRVSANDARHTIRSRHVASQAPDFRTVVMGQVMNITVRFKDFWH
jgi:hypothetical protein